MDAKVQFSAEEMRLVTDPAWILTKNSAVRKVVEFFGELSGEWRTILPWDCNPKVSRGEQYKGLPWVMLDYPRVFGKEDVLAVRTMFWWGHYFSMTLHLKGSYLRSYLPVILARRPELEAAGFWPGVSDDEWEHDHRPGTWETAVRADERGRRAPVDEGGRRAPVDERGRKAPADEQETTGAYAGGNRPFLKLSARCELDQSEMLSGMYRALINLLITQPVK